MGRPQRTAKSAAPKPLRVPTLLWIIVIFVGLSFMQYIYTKSIPEPYPEFTNVWAIIDEYTSQLQNRKISIQPQETRTFEHGEQYTIDIKRLRDLETPPTGRYVMTIRLKPQPVKVDFWIKDTMSIGLLDHNPTSLVGEFKIVTIRRQEKEEEQ